MKKLILSIALAGISATLFGQEINMAVSSTDEILSGGPTQEAAEAALEERIKVESSKKISLKKFQPNITKLINRNKGSDCEFSFEAQVEFAEPCQWLFCQNDKTLHFFIFQTNLPPTTTTNAISISNRGEQYMVFGSVLFKPNTNGWVYAGLTVSIRPMPRSQFIEESCFTNLRYISAALAQYQIEHDGKSPFDISTNSSGTLELCIRDHEGKDKNSFLHYKTLSEFLSKVNVLVCPGDSSKQAARDFQSLTATNVTYLLQTAAKDSAQFQRTVIICPIHGYILDEGGGIEKK